MERIGLAAGLLVAITSAALAAGRRPDVKNLPANTWVAIQHTTSQPAGGREDEKGEWSPAGWNCLEYDLVGKRVLFNDRWVDKRHGGYTIYGNCVFSFEPAKAVLTPLKLDSWKRIDAPNGYRTVAMPENAKEPTPVSRHVYNDFALAPELNALFICHGANGSFQKNEYGDWQNVTWRLDLKDMKWSVVPSKEHPPFRYESSLRYCPDIKSLVMSSWGDIWILDLTTNQWRRAKHSAPFVGFGGGQTVTYDPVRRRMLLAGGGPPDGKYTQASWRKLYAFDPKEETVTELAECPMPLYDSRPSYDSRHDVFLVAGLMEDKALRSGTFVYDPKKNLWSEVKTKNSVPKPAAATWNGWPRMCYDPDNDCFVALVTYNQWYLFRYVPETASVST